MSLLIRRSLTPLLVVAALFSSLACRKAAKPVAVVEGQAITQEAYKLYLSQRPQGTDPTAALDDLVRLEIAWAQAERTGLLKGADWQEAGAKIRRQVITKAYLQSLPGIAAPSEDVVRGAFLSHNEERHVFHLLVRNEQTAVAARKRLEQGEAFEKVTVELSVDPSAAQNKGDLGWITRNSVVPEFAKEVFAAKVGSLCGPFSTEFGWHVALVKEHRAAGLEAFEKNKGSLMAQAREMALKPVREDAVKPLRGKYPVKVDEGVLSLQPSAASAEADGNKVVGKVDGEPISLRDLLAFIKESMGPGGMDHGQNAATRRRFLELLADEYRLEAAAKQAGLPKRPDVQASLWLTQRRAVKNGFGRDYLLKLKPTDVDLLAYHQAHGDQFKGIGAVKVYLLVASNPAAAGKAADEARKGAAWKTLVARYANQESTGKWDPGFLAVADLKKVLSPDAVKALSLAPIETVIGPVDGPEGPMLFKILDRKVGEIMPLEQCREEVRMAYLGASQETLLQTYLDGEGRKDLKIKVYPENLKP